MNVFDWLSNMDVPVEDKFNIVEVRFKNGRKEFFRNVDRLGLTTGDAVVVEVPNGHHIGHVSLQGELVRLQMQKKKIANDGEIKKIYRLAHQKDLEKFEEVKKRELPTLYRTREIVRDLKLEMKLSDIEYQADNIKATFFYSADDRVDFRELIKLLAGEFKIRVEMRQISLRQEAGRLGGIGVCGRELCCSTWLTDFKNVATSAARYQNLSLNPSKLSGQCGRLKCCLNYELETYMDALEDIPKIEAPLQTEKGEATLQKTDIFRKIMWFGFKEENTWYPLNIERVNHILRMNREGKRPATLDIDIVEEKVMGGPLNSDLDQMDKKFKNKSRTKKKKKKGPESGQGRGNTNAQAAGAEGAAPTKDTHNAAGDQVQSGGGRQQQRNSGGNNPQQKNNPQNRQGQGQGNPRGNREQRGGGGSEGGGGNREGRSRNRNRGNRGGGQGRENRGGGEGQTPKPDNPQ
ncbi:Signal peptidase-like protein [Fulvivirgaceae bacterium QH1ED-6-2]|nr:regulatory iron-sulfur-containing complex subunit RicT [Parachryseolinea silvisoli]MCD9016879.1 Signal peptidase-like protein [Parachryseolinea silvisoli]